MLRGIVKLLTVIVVPLAIPGMLPAQPDTPNTRALEPSAAAVSGIDGSTKAAVRPVTRDQRRVTLAIATRDLARGDTLSATDFVLMDTVITWRWGSVGPDTSLPAAGWVTRRAITAGEVLRMPAVTAPPVVTSGAKVVAVWQDGLVRLTLSGVATNTAALGAPVSVRVDRNRRLDGIAVGPNTIRLRWDNE